MSEVGVCRTGMSALTLDDAAEAQSLRIGSARRSLSLVTLAWVFGSVWITATAGAPYSIFAIHLKASEFQIGLLAALPFIASFASIPAGLLTDRTGKRKSIYLCSMYA